MTIRNTLICIALVAASLFSVSTGASARTRVRATSHHAATGVAHPREAPRAARRGSTVRHAALRRGRALGHVNSRHVASRHIGRIAHLSRGVARSASRAPEAPGGAQWTGNASFYKSARRTADGGSVGAATCAHRTLPFGTKVLVTNLRSGRQVVLTVNDRGPFAAGRIVDVSVAAAGQLGMTRSGVAPVRVQVVGGSV